MKKTQFFAVILSLILCCSMVTVSFAEAYDVSIDDYQIMKQEAVNELAEQLLATESTSDFKEALSVFTDEQQAAIVGMLTEDQIQNLQNHLTEMAEEEYVYTMPKTVVFTDAGPFMPPVNVKAVKKLMAAKSPENGGTSRIDADGLITSKTVTPNTDGSYTITLESYTTGTVTTETNTMPVDIVLVLDQSGSMSDDFGRTTRQAAMKSAVTTFIQSVGEKYDAEKSDHRIAIVTFASNGNKLSGWTYANATGVATLSSSIRNLPNPSGATRIDNGMQQAVSLINNPNYTGKNTQRQQVVIVFTDGVPTSSSDFETSVANAALASSVTLKNKGVTVYSVGIFSGANEEELYGPGVESSCLWVRDSSCDGTVNSTWGRAFTTLLGSWILGDVYEWDVHAGNRFLNYLSNNFMVANEIGLRAYYADLPSYHTRGWTITKNFSRDSNKYYLTADDSTSLNAIFTQISEQIETQDINLGTTTVVKDVVTPYFDVPENASNINVYTAAANSTTSFQNRVLDSSLTPVINGNTISVSGFDYNTNYVSDTLKPNGTHGKKLIIEFTVTPKDGFLGGNGVPTNGSASGVYVGDSAIETFVQPTVDVPIPEFSIDAVDKNVYLTGSLTETQQLDGLNITIDNKTESYTEWLKGLDPWQQAYVELTNVGDNDKTNLTADTEYTAKLTIAPTTDGSVTAKEKKDTADINVFKPVLTYKDSEVKYKSTIAVPTYYDENNKVGDTVWKHGTTGSTDTGIVMIGEEPALSVSYTTDASDIDSTGKVIAKQDIPVYVSVKIGNDDVTSNVTFAHDTCTHTGCTWNASTSEFVLHVMNITADLIIKKTGLSDGDSAVFEISQGDDVLYTVTLNKANSYQVTVSDLEVGEYTVTEKTDWSWRYTCETSVKTQDIDTAPEFSFTNVPVRDQKWLDDETYVQNVFN